MKILPEICEQLREQILTEFDLGHGDAEELFRLLWNNLIDQPRAAKLSDAIDVVAEAYDI